MNTVLGAPCQVRQHDRQHFLLFLHLWPSREWTSPTTQLFFVVFSQDTPLFFHRSRNCQAIQF